MLILPQKGRVRVQSSAGATAPMTQISVPVHASSSSTKGTPTQVFASTNFDACWITVIAVGYGTNLAISAGCLDILVGSATEDILIPDLLMGNCGQWNVATQAPGKRWDFPVCIPAGTRVAAQAAGERLGVSLGLIVYLYGGLISPGFRVGSRVTTYGIGTVPNGTTITAGASGSEGAWTQVTASTSRDHFAFLGSFQTGNDSSVLGRNFSMDFGIGAATEQTIYEGWSFTDDNTERKASLYAHPVFADVPSGTRLAARVCNSGTNDSGGTYQVALHAVS